MMDIDEKWFEHIRSANGESVRVEKVSWDNRGDKKIITFTVEPSDQMKKDMKIGISLYEYDQSFIIDVEGVSLSDYERYVGSVLVDRIMESLRFAYKDYEWELGEYYMDDAEEFKKRTDEAFIRENQKWLKTLPGMMKTERVDDQVIHYFSENESNEDDLELMIVGSDGHLLCQWFEKEGVAEYRKMGREQYALDLKIETKNIINAKLILLQELVEMGYRTWLEDREMRENKY